MLLLFLPQRCRQAVEIIFKFLRQFVFGSPYFFDYLIFHLIFSHEFLRGTDFRVVITMQNTKLTDTWFHFGIIDMFEIPSHKIVDAVNGRKRFSLQTTNAMATTPNATPSTTVRLIGSFHNSGAVTLSKMTTPQPTSGKNTVPGTCLSEISTAIKASRLYTPMPAPTAKSKRRMRCRASHNNTVPPIVPAVKPMTMSTCKYASSKPA